MPYMLVRTVCTLGICTEARIRLPHWSIAEVLVVGATAYGLALRDKEPAANEVNRDRPKHDGRERIGINWSDHHYRFLFESFAFQFSQTRKARLEKFITGRRSL